MGISRFILMALTLSCLSSGAAAQPENVGRAEVYRTVGERKLNLYIFDPAPKRTGATPAILLFHGGGWNFGSPDFVTGVASEFARRGAVAIAVEYRLSVQGVTPADAFEDACEALRWVRANAAQLKIDARRIAGYGTSAGGQLISATATVGCADGTAGPDTLVLYSPAIRTSRSSWFQKLLGDKGKSADYSPLEHVSTATPATLIVNGDADTLTPVADAYLYCKAVRKQGKFCHVEIFPEVGHLLTRNLDQQEYDFDVDRETARKARAAIYAFLAEQGFLAVADAPAP